MKKKRDETDVSSKRVKRGGVHTNFNNNYKLIYYFGTTMFKIFPAL